MQKTSVQPTKWGKIALATLPGLWLVLQPRNLIAPTPTVINSAILVIICVGVVGASLVIKRRLAIWCLPALGALLWDGWSWTRQLVNMRSLWVPWVNKFYEYVYGSTGINPSTLIWSIWGVFATAILFVLYRAYRKSEHTMMWYGWAMLSLLVLVTVVVYSGNLSYDWWWVSSATIGVFKLLILLTPIAIGLRFAQIDGISSSLLVASCVPIWYNVYPDPLHILQDYAYNMPNVKFQIALPILFYLPFLSFLIIIPIGMLRSCSKRTQRWWLLLLSFLTLISLELVRGIVLIDTPNEYSFTWWLWSSLITVQLWLPLSLTAVLYSNSNLSFSKEKGQGDILA